MTKLSKKPPLEKRVKPTCGVIPTTLENVYEVMHKDQLKPQNAIDTPKKKTNRPYT